MRLTAHRLLGLNALTFALLTACTPTLSVQTTHSPIEPDRLASDDPSSDIKAIGIYMPDPSEQQLAGVWPRGHNTLETQVAFCITSEGKTDEVRTTDSSGDATVDSIFRDVVSKWRYKPYVRDKAPIRTCTSTSFRVATI